MAARGAWFQTQPGTGWPTPAASRAQLACVLNALRCTAIHLAPSPSHTSGHPYPAGRAEGWRHQPTRPPLPKLSKRRQGWQEGGKVTGSRGCRRAGQRKFRASLRQRRRRGAGVCSATGARSSKAWGEGTLSLSLPPCRCPSPPTRPVRVCGRGHSPRRGAHRAAGPDAAPSAAPPPRRPRNAAPHRAMQPGQRHNTPRDIRRPAIGRRAERRARRPLSAAVTPAAREGAAGAHTTRTHTQRSPCCPSQGSRSPRRRCPSGVGSGGRPGQRGAVAATAPAATVH